MASANIINVQANDTIKKEALNQATQTIKGSDLNTAVRLGGIYQAIFFGNLANQI